jgi:hypothetical protein
MPDTQQIAMPMDAPSLIDLGLWATKAKPLCKSKKKYHKVLPDHASHFFSRSIRALMATITVLAAINAAPTAGVSTTPHA